MNKTDRMLLPQGDAKKRPISGRRAQSLSPALRLRSVRKKNRRGVKGNDGSLSAQTTDRSNNEIEDDMSPVPPHPKQLQADRKCASLCSSSGSPSKKSLGLAQECVSSPVNLKMDEAQQELPEKELALPQCVVNKLLRAINTKRREFLKIRKQLIANQNAFLEQYTQLKELESRAGVPLGDSVGDVRIMSMTGWSANDLLLLVKDDVNVPKHPEVGSFFGSNVLSQLVTQLSGIPEEVLSMAAELMSRRLDLLHTFRGKNRSDRSTYHTNMEWKTKVAEFDQETEKLQRLVSGTAKNIEAKISYCLEVAKIPWLDRDSLLKRLERVQRELAISQNRVEELTSTNKKEDEKDTLRPQDKPSNYMAVVEELNKERAAREALKDVVSAAESMLRVARARIATLERQFKEARNDLEVSRRKHKDLEQLYRHRESSYDARSKKLMEVSKTGEMTIDALSRQRDALELRVRELREQCTIAEREADARQAEQRSRAEALQAKVVEQEKSRKATEIRVRELEVRLEQMTEKYNELFERSKKLVEVERRRCLEYVPIKESNPTERETDIWKELQVTKAALVRAEEELRQSRADKDNLLNSLSRIAQEGPHNKMAEELLDRERKITDYQQTIQDLKENEKMMEQSMAQYENRLASMRLEVKRLRNYDCYAKDVPYQDLQTELLELCLQVETLTRERSMLVSAAASRALMLERHERSANMFARVTRVRRELVAQLAGEKEVPSLHSNIEVSRSLSSMCASAAETWTALRAERARVLRLESAVLAQSLQLEREERVRTQLERRRALLEREIIRAQNPTPSEPVMNRNTLVPGFSSLLTFNARESLITFMNNIGSNSFIQELRRNWSFNDIETDLSATSGFISYFNLS